MIPSNMLASSTSADVGPSAWLRQRLPCRASLTPYQARSSVPLTAAAISLPALERLVALRPAEPGGAIAEIDNSGRARQVCGMISPAKGELGWQCFQRSIRQMRIRVQSRETKAGSLVNISARLDGYRLRNAVEFRFNN